MLPRRRLLAAILALGVTVSACGTAINTTETTTTSTVSSSVTLPVADAVPSIDDGAETITLADGTQRRFLVTPPPDGDDAPALVMVLHGIGGSAAGVRDYVDVEAVAADLGVRIVAVYPEGSGDDTGFPQSWNAGGCCPFANLDDVNDVAFLTAVIDKVRTDHSTDPNRTWVIGHSNGGMMAYRLACDMPGLVSAIGIGAGALVTPCAPTGAYATAVNLVHLHGEQDPVVPFNGGAIAGINFPSVTATLASWATAHDCIAAADTAVDTDTWTCRNGASARLVSNASWGHEWQPSWTRTMLETFLLADS
ncbi:MAG: alpha/beta hydrolase family esterase [Ilumatobacteraceae bacterium]